MELLSVIKASNDEIIVLENKTSRYFSIKCDIDNLCLPDGFTRSRNAESTNLSYVNAFEYILNKLNTNDYNKLQTGLDLLIKINFKSETHNISKTVVGREIFPDSDINENFENMKIEDYKKMITSLQHKVNNLSYRLKDAETYIAYSKDL
jgi:hypothetical protein